MTQHWYYSVNGQQNGPVTDGQLAGLLASGELRPDVLVWADGMTDWKPASTIPELSIGNAAGETPPPMQPTAPATRPTSVTVFAILNIIFGAFGLICTPFSLMGAARQSLVMHQLGHAYHMWTLISSGLGILASGVLLALGIGLLQQKGWARKGCVGYGWYAIIMGVVSLVVTISLLASRFGGMSEPAEKAMLMGGVIGGIIGGIIALIYPILLIVFMQRAIARKACVR